MSYSFFFGEGEGAGGQNIVTDRSSHEKPTSKKI